jgi:predicted ester cyclase
VSEATKALVRRLFEVWNSGRVDEVDALYAPDYVADYRPYRPPVYGPEGVKEMIRRAHATWADYHEELDELVVEGDTVALRLTVTGTHVGQFGPIAPTGRSVRFEEMLFLRIAGGKVVHQRGVVDNVHLLRQLGVLPTPAAE